ncbi:MAG: hypothetical protein LQ340_004031 [Diploschistes diacapsis]|nr:MAG: hypothetical protein LQ340_004031 [Diploschistes diacapsis]
MLINGSKVAEHVASATPESKSVLIDAFAGAGGNTIAFAKSGRWKRVYAIEKDPAVLACAKHNAQVYGVDHTISWYEGDCFEVIQKDLAGMAEFAVVFGSPPWGGPGYRTDDIFDLSQMQPYNLSALIEPFQAFTKDVVLYLPRTSNLRQVARYSEDENRITIMHYCMEGASKV